MSNAIQIIGTVVGVVAGIVIGIYSGGAGFALAGYALMGASVGYGLGAAISPTQPDMPSPGGPQMGKLDMPSADEGGIIPDVIGTTKSVGNIFWYANNHVVEEKEKVKQGKKKKWVTTGYRYYLTWAQGICMGPVDELLTVYKHEDVVWEGNLPRPTEGYASISLYDMGTMTFYFGTKDQLAPSIMEYYEGQDLSYLTTGGLRGNESNSVPAYKGLCYALFNDCYMGNYNRCPAMRFVYRKTPEISWLPNPAVAYYDYNPAAALYYILDYHTELDCDQFVDTDEFALVAQTLSSEVRGISMLLMDQVDAMTYIEGILTHINAMFYFEIDGKFHLKLLRDDVDTEQMKSYTEEDFVDTPVFNRRSWVDSVNEVQVQFSRRWSKSGDIIAWVFTNESQWWSGIPGEYGYCEQYTCPNSPYGGSERWTWQTDSVAYSKGAEKKTWMGQETNHISVLCHARYGTDDWCAIIPSSPSGYLLEDYVDIYQQMSYNIWQNDLAAFQNLFLECIKLTRYARYEPRTFFRIAFDSSGSMVRVNFEPAISQFIEWCYENFAGITIVQTEDDSERWMPPLHEDMGYLGYTGF